MAAMRPFSVRRCIFEHCRWNHLPCQCEVNYSVYKIHRELFEYGAYFAQLHCLLADLLRTMAEVFVVADEFASSFVSA